MSGLDKINLLCYHMPDWSRQSMFDSEELTALELAGKVAQKLNDALDMINSALDAISGKEDSSFITTNRKLSASGDFTGTLAGESISQMKSDINNSLSLAQTVIDMVNSRESIGTIYDGGLFTDTEPPTITIEGGTF